MSPDIPELDWKVFRQLQPIALERFCERVLTEVARITGDTARTSHQRYLALYKLIKNRDDEIARAFNDMRRSTAMRQIVIIQSHKLWSDAELARFTPETRATLQSWLELT